VGFAKGDYLQRLKAEWDETAKAKEAAAAAAVARKAPVTTPYKARPALRLRRRPGEIWLAAAGARFVGFSLAVFPSGREGKVRKGGPFQQLTWRGRSIPDAPRLASGYVRRELSRTQIQAYTVVRYYKRMY